MLNKKLSGKLHLLIGWCRGQNIKAQTEGRKAGTNRAVMVHAFTLAFRKAEIGRSLWLWTKWVPGKSEIHRATLFWKVKQKEKEIIDHSAKVNEIFIKSSIWLNQKR